MRIFHTPRGLRHIVLMGVICLVVVMGLSGESRAVGQGAQAPDFSLVDTSGNTVTLSQMKGKVVVVNFFTVTCQPCRHEMPDLNAIYKENRDKGLVMLGICLNVDPNQLKVFAKQLNLEYPFLVGTEKVSKDYGDIAAVPTTFIITKEGKVAEKIEGPRNKAEFLKLITPLL